MEISKCKNVKKIYSMCQNVVIWSGCWSVLFLLTVADQTSVKPLFAVTLMVLQSLTVRLTIVSQLVSHSLLLCCLWSWSDTSPATDLKSTRPQTHTDHWNGIFVSRWFVKQKCFPAECVCVWIKACVSMDVLWNGWHCAKYCRCETRN